HMFSLLDQKKYDQVADYVAQAANNLQSAGANFGVMCGNTPHIVFNEIQNRTTLPLLSMVQTSLDKAKEKGLKNLGLLGTKFTMQN
ncbi:aspartate/glutamate racemase family protein, partial [Streptomyces scabiei]